MGTRTYMFIGLIAMATIGWLAGCGNESSGGDASATQRSGGEAESAAADALTVPAAMRAFSDDGDVLEVRIEGTDQMKFSTDAFEVKPGQMVRLTLAHVGTLPAAAMGHNLVIIEQGEDFMEFAADANEQGATQDNAYVPEPVRGRVIALTDMIGGGASSTITFQAPAEAGDYPFLCTFPGHAAQMNGVMTVKP